MTVAADAGAEPATGAAAGVLIADADAAARAWLRAALAGGGGGDGLALALALDEVDDAGAALARLASGPPVHAIVVGRRLAGGPGAALLASLARGAAGAVPVVLTLADASGRAADDDAADDGAADDDAADDDAADDDAADGPCWWRSGRRWGRGRRWRCSTIGSRGTGWRWRARS